MHTYMPYAYMYACIRSRAFKMRQESQHATNSTIMSMGMNLVKSCVPVCAYVCMHACMYVCMYVWALTRTWSTVPSTRFIVSSCFLSRSRRLRWFSRSFRLLSTTCCTACSCLLWYSASSLHRIMRMWVHEWRRVLRLVVAQFALVCSDILSALCSM